MGPDNPPWMSPWGRFTTGFSMLGHIFSKADRASAEQGVELRSPLLGFDHISMTKEMPPEWMFTEGKAKGLLKSYLKESWPDWYINRRKMGFPFRIRYAWGFGCIPVYEIWYLKSRWRFRRRICPRPFANHLRSGHRLPYSEISPKFGKR